MDEKKQYQSAEWRAEFRAQSTPKTMQAALRCADIEISRLHRLEIPFAWDAEDLVQKTITATCEGRLAWDPNKVGLRAHLRDKIRLACRRLRRRRRVVVETVEISAVEPSDPVWNERTMITDGPEAGVMITDMARRVEAELWRLAEGDQVALRVLAAMSEGDVTTNELVEATGLSSRTIENAKARLQRLGSRVSPELLADIRAELNLDASGDDRALDRSDDGLE
jgi:DNA-directed RNA polymerase specialized sigma24 family protein